jgi:F0F1-type ATP synthase membrane subunit b/b'
MVRLNQKGQGATEYIVILAIIVGVAVFLFTGPFSSALNSKIAAIASSISSAGNSTGGNP